MNLVENLKVNMKVKALILSKYESESDLNNATGLEARFYRQLKSESDKVQSALNCGGIAEKVDNGDAI